MKLLPTTLGTRPRLAVEIRAEGVVAARANDAEAVLAAVAHVEFLSDAGEDRAALVAAVRKTLEAVALRERTATLVLPDAAVRVLLLDFDELPSKPAEAVPVVRFRLKKLLPFEVEDAVVSYQVMTSGRNLVKVLAVAVPKPALAEYERIVREAGFEPGAVLPSTLAMCAGLSESSAATLLVNASEGSVTTAIVREGELLLHRMIDLNAQGAGAVSEDERLRESWPPLNEDQLTTEANRRGEMLAEQFKAEADGEARAQMLPLPPAPELESQRRAAREVTQAVSVAAAYFEDTLQQAPEVMLAAGSLGAERLDAMLRQAGFAEQDIRVEELVTPAVLAAGAATARVPKGWLAGVRGALRS